MPYSSPQPSSVQWQAQFRRRSAPHSPTLQPRSTPPESVEDLSFSDTELGSESAVVAPIPVAKLPSISPKAASPFQSLSPPTSQKSPTPSPPKLPVSNASTSKARVPKERQTASPEPERTPAPASSISQLFNTQPLVGSARRHANGAGNAVKSGVDKALSDSQPKAEAALPVASVWPPLNVEVPALPSTSAPRDSDEQGGQTESTPDDLDKSAILAENQTGM